MPKLTPVLPNSEPDPVLIGRLSYVKRGCLAAVAIITAGALCGWRIPAVARILPAGWQLMRGNTALAMLLSAISIACIETRRSTRKSQLGLLLAAVITLLATAVFIEDWFHLSLGIDNLLAFDSASQSLLPGRSSPETAVAFMLLGLSVMLIPVQGALTVCLADMVTGSLCFLELVLVSGYIFGARHVFSPSYAICFSPQALLCFLLLTAVVFLRRAERGVLSIFLGHGIGSGIAKILGPILVVLPVLRELGRARLLEHMHLPEASATTILTSYSALVACLLLLALTWRIKSMELQIHDLSLRDELTGLYNLRGFDLLAEQALRLAQRSQLPFSVLFIDMDNLKGINDSLGHNAGSAFLAEAGELLRETFREADVLGRIGGDEFVVVCQCGQLAIASAAQRLEAAAALRNAQAKRQFPFSLSIGFITAKEYEHLSLKELLAEADKAMYEAKRSKKASRELPALLPM